MKGWGEGGVEGEIATVAGSPLPQLLLPNTSECLCFHGRLYRPLLACMCMVTWRHSNEEGGGVHA